MDDKELFVNEIDCFETTETAVSFAPQKKSDKNINNAVLGIEIRQNENANFAPTWHEVKTDSKDVQTANKEESGAEGQIVPMATVSDLKGAYNEPETNLVPTWHEVGEVEFVETNQNDYFQNEEQDFYFDFYDVPPETVDDPYIYFDYTPQKDHSVNHDKMALKQTSTDAGGGAKFHSRYTKQGTLVSALVLDKQDKRNPRNLGLFERDMQMFSDATSDEETSEASMLDTSIEAALYHVVDKENQTRKRYAEIRKDTSKEVKYLKKELHQEKKGEFKQEIDVSTYFPEALIEFSNDEESFSNLIEDSFHREDVYVEQHFKESVYISESDVRHDNNTGTDKKENADESKNYELAEVEDVSSEQEWNVDEAELEPRREMTKEEKLEQTKSNQKASRKEENKSIRKMAAVTAVSKLINAKKKIQDDAENVNFKSSGDLTKDGASGVLQTIIDTAKQISTSLLISAGSAVGKFLFGIASSLIGPVLLIIIALALVIGTVSVAGGAIVAICSDSGEIYDLDVDGDGYVYESLSEDEINAIIENLYATYEDMGYVQETVLRYSLSKVGCEYNQDYHFSLTADIFDCSSLAYRSYLQAGIDISNSGYYTAAEECRAMVNQDKIVNEELKPGDLIFYGGSSNGRYLGVYHVAIYVGKKDGVDKMVEARGTDWGVVYCDVRTANVVKIARPY